MTIAEFILALFVLLLTPGPTNTLLALAGTERGWQGALRLIPAEVAAYALVTVPLALAGGSLVAEPGPFRFGVTLLAAVWVAYLAISMWRLPAGQAMGPGQNGALKIFTTTLLNPKGLVIGLIFLPSQPHLWTAAAIFLAILLVVSAIWAGLGSLMDGGPAMQPTVRRACAGWLGLLSLWLAAASFTG